jgi:hypothetical protein
MLLKNLPFHYILVQLSPGFAKQIKKATAHLLDDVERVYCAIA